MQAKGLARIRLLVDRYDRDGRPVPLRAGQEYLDTLTLTEAIRLVETGVRIERLGRELSRADVVPVSETAPAVVGTAIGVFPCTTTRRRSAPRSKSSNSSPD